VKNWLLFSHTSTEPGHQVILTELDAHPLLDFNMRLGEGSGAATAVPLLQLACKLHNEMASFSESGVTSVST
jgi:nicotinate-nucleotide--dimethylbenzimidazole phosphoribosyltransferase